MAEKAFAFENFPRGKLPAQLTRRQFFAGLMNEVRAFARDEDHPVYRLSDLGELADAELAFVVPVLLPGSEVVERDGFMWGRAPGGRNSVRLFPAEFGGALCAGAARWAAEHCGSQPQFGRAVRLGKATLLCLRPRGLLVVGAGEAVCAEGQGAGEDWIG